MVQRKIGGRQRLAAVLASIAVAQQNVFAREGARLIRDAAILEQPNYRRHGDAAALRVQHQAVLFLRARNAFEHQHQSAASAANINRLIGCVQHQNRHL